MKMVGEKGLGEERKAFLVGLSYCFGAGLGYVVSLFVDHYEDSASYRLYCL